MYYLTTYKTGRHMCWKSFFSTHGVLIAMRGELGRGWIHKTNLCEGLWEKNQLAFVSSLTVDCLLFEILMFRTGKHFTFYSASACTSLFIGYFCPHFSFENMQIGS